MAFAGEWSCTFSFWTPVITGTAVDRCQCVFMGSCVTQLPQPVEGDSCLSCALAALCVWMWVCCLCVYTCRWLMKPGRLSAQGIVHSMLVYTTWMASSIVWRHSIDPQTKYSNCVEALLLVGLMLPKPFSIYQKNTSSKTRTLKEWKSEKSKNKGYAKRLCTFNIFHVIDCSFS